MESQPAHANPLFHSKCCSCLNYTKELTSRWICNSVANPLCGERNRYLRIELIHRFWLDSTRSSIFIPCFYRLGICVCDVLSQSSLRSLWSWWTKCTGVYRTTLRTFQPRHHSVLPTSTWRLSPGRLFVVILRHCYILVPFNYKVLFCSSCATKAPE